MTLFEKILQIYPALKASDFHPISGTIHLQNDGDGDYIAEWNHPTFDKPTDDKLKGI